MNIKRTKIMRAAGLVALMMLLGTFSFLRADNGTCNGINLTVPFIDVGGNPFFCAIAEAYFSGLTNGTSPTTYSPVDPVAREQMAAFITRTLDQSLKRGSRRASLGQWWTQKVINSSALTASGDGPAAVKSDGRDLWVASSGGTVTRVRASDGKVLETWTGMSAPHDLIVANGRIYVAGGVIPGKLYAIDPDQPAGAATLLTDTGSYPTGIAYNGEFIMLACFAGSGVTIYHVPSQGMTTVQTGFSQPSGVIYDGSFFWVTDVGDAKLKKVNVNGQILQSLTLDSNAYQLSFDGTNIWVPCRDSNSLSVVRASTGAEIATLSGNGLDGPVSAAFDGQRIMIVNNFGSSVSLWRATDLAPLGWYSTGANSSPFGVCSDGLNFWITLSASDKLARF